jgi:hypothetical protein
VNGEKKFLLVVAAVVMICLTVVYAFLFISLWPYRQWVGASLLAVVVLAAVVWMSGKLNEQALRRVRYRHHEETPLDAQGEPYYWQQGMQPNPSHGSAHPVQMHEPLHWQ